jgi:guanylate kinase
MKKGKIFFISGPSGVGKGTLINALRENHTEFEFPPSCTTRDPRPGEINGKTYFFITKDEFEQKIKNSEFLEYACVHGKNFYGTLKAPLLDPIKNGKIVIREFDVQGFEQARERLPKETFVSIFLKPAESVAQLVERIKERAPISDEDLQERIISMENELKKSEIYDYIIISEEGKIEKLITDTEKIIKEESFRS